MGKVAICNNYRAKLGSVIYEYYAVSPRQAWYMAYEYFENELIDSLESIDAYGHVVDVLKREEEE